MKIARVFVLALTIMTPMVSLFSNPPQTDIPAEIVSARRGLKGAYSDLEHAGGNWGGHRAEAMKHIQAALAELEEAEKYAREHHDMK